MTTQSMENVITKIGELEQKYKELKAKRRPIFKSEKKEFNQIMYYFQAPVVNDTLSQIERIMNLPFLRDHLVPIPEYEFKRIMTNIFETSLNDSISKLKEYYNSDSSVLDIENEFLAKTVLLIVSIDDQVKDPSKYLGHIRMYREMKSISLECQRAIFKIGKKPVIDAKDRGILYNFSTMQLYADVITELLRQFDRIFPGIKIADMYLSCDEVSRLNADIAGIWQAFKDIFDIIIKDISNRQDKLKE